VGYFLLRNVFQLGGSGLLVVFIFFLSFGGHLLFGSGSFKISVFSFVYKRGVLRQGLLGERFFFSRGLDISMSGDILGKF